MALSLPASRVAAETPLPGRAAASRRRLGPVTVVALVTLGLLQVMSLLTPEYLLPSPASMLRSLVDIVVGEPFSVFITLVRLVAGVVASFVLGSILGVLMGFSPRVAVYSEAAMFMLSGIPALSWMLLAVLWFPHPEARVFFVLFVVLLPFYALNVSDGIRALPKDWVEMLEMFRPSKLQIFRLLVWPHLVPYVILTTRSVLGYAIRMVIFAELIGAATGAGARLAYAQGMLRIDRVFAWTILLVVMNFALQAVVGLIDRRLLGWRPAVQIR